MITIKELAFTDKGMHYKFSIMDPELEIDSEFQFSTYDMRGSDRFFFNMGKVRQGIDKILYGPALAERMREYSHQLPDYDPQAGTAVFTLQKIVFGANDIGKFAVFYMAAGLRTFDDAGTLKLPKAFYTLDEKNFNLFPCEDQEELKAVKEEGERMIRDYMRKVGRACESMFDEELNSRIQEKIVRPKSASSSDAKIYPYAPEVSQDPDEHPEFSAVEG